MKTNPIRMAVLLLLVVALKTNAQDEAFYQEKIDHYMNLKRTGTTIALIGIPVAIAGVIIYSVGEHNLDSDSGDDNVEGFFQIPAGIALTAIGSAGFITGIVLNSVGRQRMAEYQKKLDGLKIGIYLAPHQTGFTLTYRF